MEYCRPGTALSDETAVTATEKLSEGSALAFTQEFMLEGSSGRAQLGPRVPAGRARVPSQPSARQHL